MRVRAPSNPTLDAVPDRLVLRPHGVAAGGAAVAREDGGRVVFVEGALPDEQVAVEVVEERRSFARGRIVEVVEASPHRIEPPCPHVADGCGGCRWQHVEPSHQPDLKRRIVADALARIGKLGAADELLADIGLAPPLPTTGYRTTVRAAVVEGHAGLRHHHSHEVLALDSCLVAHPGVEELLVGGRFDGATEVTLRIGPATAERLVLATPTAAGVSVPGDVLVVGADELAAGRRAWFHDQVAGRSWRISASSFFQSRADGAAQLVEVVRAAVEPHVRRDRTEPGTLVDLCCGVGLFAGAVAAPLGTRAVGVERHGAAVHDARRNLAGDDATVVRSSLDGWRPSPADVVVADPARSGLGDPAVRSVAATGAGLVVLVSCDPGALGRDAGLLRRAGYRWQGSTLVDLFPHTPEVEVVSTFQRDGAGPLG